MKNLILLFLMGALNVFSQAPSIQWQKSYGSQGEESAYSVAQTSDGGYIFVGRTNSGGGDVVGYRWNYDLFAGDVWVVKTNQRGVIEWQKTYGGSANDGGLKIRKTTDGGYIIAAVSESFNGDVTNNIGGYDYWVLKINDLGTIQWQKRLGGPGDDYIRDIKQTTDGGYIVIGYSDSKLPNGHGLKDIFVVKLTNTGAIGWQKAYGGALEDWGYAISQTKDGGYIFTGKTKSIDGDVTINKGDFDVWVVKTNSIGTIEWQKTLGGSKEDFGLDIMQSSDGNYIMSASTLSSNGDLTVNKGSYDLWVVKLNTTGNIIWQKVFGGTNGESYSTIETIQTHDGGFVICSDANSNNGDATGNHSNDYSDVWVVKLDSSGNKQWHRCLGGSAEDYGHGVFQTSDNGYVVAGVSRTNIVNPNNPDWTPNNGSYDAWIIKLNPTTVSSIENIIDNKNITIYPNPVSNTLNIQTRNNEVISKIVVFDMMTHKLLQINEHTSKINTENLANGIYFIQVSVADKLYTLKFIKA